MKNKKLAHILSVLPLVILLALVATGYKTFVVWSQVTYYIGYTPERQDTHVRKTLYEQKVISDRGKLSKLGPLTIPDNLTEENMIALFGPLKSLEVEVEETTEEPKTFAQQAISKAMTYLHSPRALLVSPAIFLGTNWGWNMHRIFSFQVVLLLMFFVFLIGNYVVLEKAHPLFLSLISVSVCGLSLMMNGRMIFSLIGAALFFVLVSGVRNKKIKPNSAKEFFCCAFFLFMSSISTGVFVINYAIILLYFFWNMVTKQRSFNESLMLLAISVLNLPFFYMAIRKNLMFFGGDLSALWKILGHGYGKVLLDNLALSAICLLFVTFVLMKNYQLLLKARYEYLAFFLGIAGGIFGYSTTTAAIVPLMLLLIQSSKSLSFGLDHQQI